jgi:LmbE family N-acetylglucosaminyl deacetylase
MTGNESKPPVLMAVMAHPDDESTLVGGTLALYALRGVRTVLVTCTNGEFGDASPGVKPGNPGHDTRSVAAARIAELRRACDHLLVSDLELLGHHDSGLPDLIGEQDTAFCAIPVDAAAAEIGTLIERYRPQVVLTHEPTSTMHPDHVHASETTTLAVRDTAIPAKLYYAAHGTRYWERLSRALNRDDIALLSPSPDRLRITDQVDRWTTTSIDITSVVDRKRAGLFSHSSQIHNSLTAKVPEHQWRQVFRAEDYIRVIGAGERDEHDLYAGMPQWDRQ